MSDLQRIAIASSQIDNRQQVRLTAEQQHYLTRVLRLGKGDRFIVMDGGSWWLAILQVDSFKGELSMASLQEQLPVKNELPLPITLIVALPKQGFDDIVRYTCELGLSSIIPTISSRTLLKPSPQKLERWRRIATEAAEQSERQMVPTILEPQKFTAVLSDLQSEPALKPQKYICVARKNSPHLLDLLAAKTTNKQEKTEAKTEFLSNNNFSIIIATGPEGGWTDAEVEAAITSGFQPVSLGRRILRAVTAPIVALSLVAAVLETKF